ncbi:DUF1642 domain-containing protein [Lactococcus lactis]|uniref:DUF1642 domain-containing protein n=1 Tax=Lactococcus lactis TaxID=1358 RepID=UPI0018A9CAB6|nr:DUF1642 domain-containing protein [Lactococcus lactis]
MTKFEEEAKEKILNSSYLYIAQEGERVDVDKGAGIALKIKDVVYVFPWLEFARNWHSDEEFQELLDKYSNLNDNYEKEVIRSSKLESQLISREKQVIELREADKAQGKEIIQLKSQLQQQALPVVPEFVAEWYEEKKNKLELAVYKINTLIDKKSFNDLTKIEKWFEGVENKPIETIFKMKDGYTVEKPQMFEVKMPIVYWDDDASQLTNGFEFLRIDKETDEVDFIGFLSNTKKHTVYFTEQEIKSIDERYWQFAVPVEDNK